MIVADANLIAYFWLPGERTAVAEAIMQRDAAWCAPLLWRSEFRNILANYVRRHQMDLATAQRVAQDAETLFATREFAVPSAVVLAEAARSSCSAYDCEYAVLAKELGVALVTTDKGLLKAFADVAVKPEDYVRGLP
jgi:predicted nucleic acid-binding protein